MKEIETSTYHYERISEAIRFIHANFKRQPSLEEIAAHVHLSPFHFQRIFSEWTGISPKKMLQYISLSHAKSMLVNQQATLFDTALETGLSGSSRLHDLFVSIEGMTPAEYKNAAKALQIDYQFYESPFGLLLIASTSKGICFMAFYNEEILALKDLKSRFPAALFTQKNTQLQAEALAIFSMQSKPNKQIKLHLKGSNFQLKVWEALLKLPLGKLSSYGQLAATINEPNAARAVGTAIGNNPIAYLIPCHRVIQASGLLGGYRWGLDRKASIIAWEAAQQELDKA
jgi:AraC family transcriptional regulator of adaptative response/methylated-DNA-[protein]-cysteine methyltransferase